MRRLMLIAVAAVTIVAFADPAFAAGRVYVYTSGGRRYSRPYRTYHHRTRYYRAYRSPRRTYYYTTRYPRSYRYYRPAYRRVYYAYRRPAYRRVYYSYSPRRYCYCYYDYSYYDYWGPPVRVYYYYGY